LLKNKLRIIFLQNHSKKCSKICYHAANVLGNKFFIDTSIEIVAKNILNDSFRVILSKSSWKNSGKSTV